MKLIVARAQGREWVRKMQKEGDYKGGVCLVGGNWAELHPSSLLGLFRAHLFRIRQGVMGVKYHADTCQSLSFIAYPRPANVDDAKIMLMSHAKC